MVLSFSIKKQRCCLACPVHFPSLRAFESFPLRHFHDFRGGKWNTRHSGTSKQKFYYRKNDTRREGRTKQITMLPPAATLRSEGRETCSWTDNLLRQKAAPLLGADTTLQLWGCWYPRDSSWWPLVPPSSPVTHRFYLLGCVCESTCVSESVCLYLCVGCLCAWRPEADARSFPVIFHRTYWARNLSINSRALQG